MRPLNILIQSRTSLFRCFGGDTIQILKTKEELIKLGAKVELSLELEPSLKNCDLVHVFNISRPQEVYLQSVNAKAWAKPLFLSPIFCPYSEYDLRDRAGFAGLILRHIKVQSADYVKVIGRALANRELHKGSWQVMMRGFEKTQKLCLGLADMVLPNSTSEIDRLKQAFKPENEYHFRVIQNGVDTNIFDYSKTVITPEKKKYLDCILCVARIEGVKNQLRLVRALKKTGLKLILIGNPAPNHHTYFKYVLQEGESFVTWFGHLDQYQLAEFYKLAKVHVLPSWMETTGLSALEAGVMRCNIVITNRGDTKSYFGNNAFYCEPSSEESIRENVLNAFNTPKTDDLMEKIKRDFTWHNAAVNTLEAYKSLLNDITGELRH